MGKVLTLALMFRLAGLAWGLPASDGWDDDGVAPRDFLVGVFETYSPGHYYTYPPLHLVILAVASLPIWVVALARCPSTEPAAVVQSFIAVPTMTALAVVARAVTVALSLGILWNVAKIAEDLRGTARAGIWVSLACAANIVFTYYSQTTNLDVPYLFWGLLAVRWLIHAFVRHEPRTLRRVPVLAALAIATKDQAYALFLLSIPLSLLTFFAVDRRARALARPIFRELAYGTAIAAATLLVVDGAVTNSSGFGARLRFLLGPASQDHAFYASDWTGRMSALRDVVANFGQHYAWVMAPFVLFGLATAWRSAGDPARRAASLVPLFVAISFTVAFNLTARRTEHRFVLPQSIIWGIYAGLGFDAIASWLGPARIWTMRALSGACLGSAFFACASVDAAMLFDPRYDAESWLRAHVAPGDQIEIYDNDVHCIRLPPESVVARIGLTPVVGRNPLPNVTELQDRFSNVEARRPRFIVVSDFWMDKYFVEPSALERQGRVASAVQTKTLADADSRIYFHSLRDGQLAYRTAHRSEYGHGLWPRLEIHGTLTGGVWIFEHLEGT